ncbi:MAG: proline racemase family protein [Candidatus Cloacimonetes bacterium]|nr:proline racemase family protein [Candidatus Cloacimonadota bacterium]
MRIKKLFQTIDTHTAGEPTRTITGGIPYIPGKTMSEKMLYFKKNKDWIRQALMFEPRGNNVMSGVILSEPCNPEADIGVFFIEVGGYLPMCGHDTIGVSTALIEGGIVEVKEPVTKIKLDTPAGLVEVKVKVKDNVAQEVTFKNVPAFLFAEDAEVDIEGFDTNTVDIAYGGNYYIIVEADSFNLELVPENATDINRVGNIIKAAVNEQIEICHPEKDFINEATHVMFCGKAKKEKADVKNVVVIPPGSIDRSPCGTGTSSRLATFYAKGELSTNQTLTFESIINTCFKGRVLEETKVGSYKAVIPEITGSAYVTGLNQWVIDPEDPIPEGYLLGR